MHGLFRQRTHRRWETQLGAGSFDSLPDRRTSKPSVGADGVIFRERHASRRFS